MTWDALNTKWNEWILAYGPDNQSRFMEWLGMEEPDWRKMMLTLVTILVVLVTIISILLMLRYRPPPKDKAAQLYRKFTESTGVDPEQGETPLSYALRLGTERSEVSAHASQVTSLYLDARYGPPEISTIHKLNSAVREFIRRA
jgi:hypothetical protein